VKQRRLDGATSSRDIFDYLHRVAFPSSGEFRVRACLADDEDMLTADDRGRLQSEAAEMPLSEPRWISHAFSFTFNGDGEPNARGVH
jgi:hypothetical protein